MYLIPYGRPGPKSTEYFLLRTSRKVGEKTDMSKLAHTQLIKFSASKKKKKKLYPLSITEKDLIDRK